MEKDELFSDDPEENLRIENDFLKLKLKAQYGDAFFMDDSGYYEGFKEIGQRLA